MVVGGLLENETALQSNWGLAGVNVRPCGGRIAILKMTLFSIQHSYYQAGRGILKDTKTEAHRTEQVRKVS